MCQQRDPHLNFFVKILPNNYLFWMYQQRDPHQRCQESVSQPHLASSSDPACGPPHRSSSWCSHLDPSPPCPDTSCPSSWCLSPLGSSCLVLPHCSLGQIFFHGYSSCWRSNNKLEVLCNDCSNHWIVCNG